MAEEEKEVKEPKVEPKKERPKEGGLETIVPVLASIEIAEVKCNVRRLKFHETLLLWRIIAGASKKIPWTTMQNWDIATIVAMLLMAIPNAEREFYDFLKGVLDIVPDEEMPRRKVFAYIDTQMENKDVVTIIGKIAEQEKGSWAELGKQIASIMEVMTKK